MGLGLQNGTPEIIFKFKKPTNLTRHLQIDATSQRIWKKHRGHPSHGLPGECSGVVKTQRNGEEATSLFFVPVPQAWILILRSFASSS